MRRLPNKYERCILYQELKTRRLLHLVKSMQPHFIGYRVSTGSIWGRLRKRKIKHAKEIRSFSTSFVVPGTTDTKRETEKRWLFGLSEGCSAGCPAIQPIADQSDPRS